jgi:membrane protease YdiL (CAAX protease family)
MAFMEIFYLIYIGVLIPRAAWRSAKIMRTTPERVPSLTRIYLLTGISMAVLGLMTFVVARFAEIELLPKPTITPRVVLIAAAALVAKLAFVFIRLYLKKGINAATVALAPRTRREGILAVLLIALASVVEECAYRGLAFLILFTWTGSLIAAIFCSIAFGLAHLVQGRRAVVITFIYALIDHAVYLTTGTLWVLIVSHFIYDTMVGFALSSRKVQQESALLSSPS